MSAPGDSIFNIWGIKQERLSLPHLRSNNYKVSVFRLLKDLIGKDLTKVSMPVYLNEPISVVQKLVECCEYTSILDMAAKEPNPTRRLALVSCYNISRFCFYKDRKLKPFNSLLGETYEMITKDWKFVSE